MRNPLWEFSLATYRHGEVAATCLALQDSFDADVNLLLYAAWLAQLNWQLSERHLAELNAVVTDWRDGVVKPLRALRRQLHAISAAAGVYEELKTIELRAEQQQQEMMYAHYQASVGFARVDQPLLANLTQVALLASPQDRGWVTEIGRLASLIPL